MFKQLLKNLSGEQLNKELPTEVFLLLQPRLRLASGQEKI